MATGEQNVPRLRRIAGRAVLALSMAVCIGAVIMVLRRLDTRPRTTDAIVTANVIHVAPEIVGRIATLNVKDDAVVRKGDVLFTIEQERYALVLARARAEVQALEAQIDLTNRVVSSQVTGVSVASTRVNAARARLKQANDTLSRLEPLLPDGYVTPEQVDLARTAKATAESDLSGALGATQQTRQAVGDAKPLMAQLDAARAQVGLADGRVVGVTTSVGQIVDPVRALFTLIDTSQWYVVADFRETELERMRPGERVTAYVMSSPGVHLTGDIESIGSAVAELENLAIAGIPPVKRDLNWIHIAQRFPVRIALKQPPEELMRIGASAVVVVHHDGGDSTRTER